MIGTIANTCTILLGSLIGSVFKKGIKKEHQDALYTAMGLAATGLGINAVVQNMPNSVYPVLFIASLAIGSLIGTALDIDGAFTRLVRRFSIMGAAVCYVGLMAALAVGFGAMQAVFFRREKEAEYDR